MLFQSYFFKNNIFSSLFFKKKKIIFIKIQTKKKENLFKSLLLKNRQTLFFFFSNNLFLKIFVHLHQVSFKFFMHGCFESSFLRIASLQVCAYGSILLNQQAPIKLTCYPPRFLALMFFLLCFCMINEKNMVNDNKVLSFLLSLFYFYVVNIHMLNIQ